MTSLLRQNDMTTPFWHNNDVITPRVREVYVLQQVSHLGWVTHQNCYNWFWLWLFAYLVPSQFLNQSAFFIQSLLPNQYSMNILKEDVFISQTDILQIIFCDHEMGVIPSVGITRTIILVPCLWVKSLQLLWRSSQSTRGAFQKRIWVLKSKRS